MDFHTLPAKHCFYLAILMAIALVSPRAGYANPTFQEAFDKQISIMLLIEPTTGNIVDANQAAGKFYGYPRDYLRTMTIQEINTLTPEQVAEERKQARIEGRNFFIFRHRVADGEIKTVEVHSVPLDFGGRTLLYSIIRDISKERALLQDIWHYQSNLEQMVEAQTHIIEKKAFQTVIIMGGSLIFLLCLVVLLIFALKRGNQARKKAEEKEVSLRKLSQAVEQSPATVIITDANGLIEYVNPKFEEITGYSFDDALGQNPSMLSSGQKSKEEYKELWQTILSGNDWQGEFRNRRKDGTLYWENSIISPIKAPDGSITNFLAVKEDITERKKVEETLRANEELLSNLTAQAPGLLYQYLLRPDGTSCFPYVSDAVHEIFGLAPENIKENADAVFATGHPEEAEKIAQKIIQSAENLTPWHDEFRVILSGQPSSWREGRAIPQRLEDGSTLWHGFITNIDQRKHLEEQVRRSQKMEAVGLLTGGIAHDFNNILGIILGNLELLQRMVSDNEKASNRVEKALNGAKRGAKLTRRLLSFSRKVPEEVILTQVNEFIGSLEDLIAKSLMASINVETKLSVGLWPVEIDPSDLEDAILNLSLNARDAMPDGGTLTVETSNVTLDEDYVSQNPGSKVGDFVMISLKDTGVGMSTEVKEKILEPFFTTKDQSKGTGLGLSMVYGFVQRSNGHLKIISEINKGTTFRIYLPRALKEEQNEQGASEEVTLPRGTETILVVDDEQALLDIAVSQLEELGYKTHSAFNGKEALRVLEDNSDIDLLFSDVIMPDDLDGYQLAFAVNETHSNLKVLLASGFTEKREAYIKGDNKYMAALATNLLKKPYTQSEMAQAIRQALDEE
ncbi:MAG: PAS domain S-box protein [Alphaproteobacteria bacterium]|nr:PAS domain S-box protein [Alphaproteobacteria bacterium]